MPLLKFTKDEIVRIKTFLELGWSFSVIQKKLEEEGKSISKGYLTKLKNGESHSRKPKCRREKPTSRLRALSEHQLAALKKAINDPNPPTQRALANRFGCSQFTIRYAIKKLGKRRVTKPKGHFLSAATIEKRRRRSWPLYLRLRGNRWEKVITSDEAWFYLTDTGRRRSIQYISRDAKRSDAEVQVHVQHPRGVMVWVGFSANGISKPLFIDPGAKISAEYYKTRVLEPFFSKEASKMYPNGGYVFHQDSAPSHKAKSTIRWLKEHRIAFITPEQWMPSSPDASPCDYFLWGYLKGRLNARKPRSVEGLKKAIADELRKVPLEMIRRALRAWPQRCRQIRYAGGRHIENFRK